VCILYPFLCHIVLTRDIQLSFEWTIECVLVQIPPVKRDGMDPNVYETTLINLCHKMQIILEALARLSVEYSRAGKI